MKYSNSIEYNISTKLDKSGITQLKNELQSLELILHKRSNKGLIDEKEFSHSLEQIRGLESALTEAFNPSLGMINLSKLNAGLKENEITATSLKQAFSNLGADGQVAFNNFITEIGKLDIGVRRTSSAIDKMAVTFSNTFRWGLISSFFSQFMNAIHSSVQYAKDLDESLTQIMLVTDYSRDSMNEYARAANEAAKAVGQTTVGMTNASLIFAQQGYDLNQSQQLATLSAKLANASQQDTAATSDQITAYMNAYGLQNSMDELVQAMDNWAKIANISAADVEEIALASQRAASMANAVGVSGEALAAQIATIESVTREAPEQIGNGLKTLYARFSDLQLGKEDEDGIGLGKVTSTLQQIGVQVLDSLGNVRSMDDIMEDLMAIWQDLDDTTQEAVAQTLAGKHQVNRFTALMDNADMYQEYLGATGASASGTLEEMNAEYLDSLQGRLTKLQSTLEGLFSSIFNTDDIYPWIDAVQGFLDLIQDFVDAIGGAGPVLTGILALVTQLFSKNIAQGITDSSINAAVQRQRAENYKNKEATLQQWGAANPNPEDPNSVALLDSIQKLNTLSMGLSTEQWKQGNQLLIELRDNANNAAKAEENLNKESEALKIALGSILGQNSTLVPFTDDKGFLNTENLTEFLKTLDKNGLKDIFKGSKEEIQNTVSELKNFYDALKSMKDELKNAGSGSEDFSNSIQRGREALQSLSNIVDEEKFGKLEGEFEKFAASLLDGSYDIEETEDGIRKLNSDISLLIETLIKFTNADMTPQDLDNLINKIHQLRLTRNNAQAGADNANKTMGAFFDAAQMQKFVDGIVKAIGAINQLAFGIQSIQNLGSILSDDDIEPLEKFTKSFMVITTAAPSVVFAFKTLKESSNEVTQSLTKQSLANTQLSISEAVAKAGTISETIAFGAEAIAAKAAAIAIKGLSVALKFLSGPGGWIVAGVITAIGIALNKAKQDAEEAKEAVEDAIDTFNTSYNRTQVDTSNFDELYEKYKKTGIASDELTEAGKQLSEQLGIVGGSTLAASGNFEELAREITGAKEEALLLADIEANNAINKIAERNETQTRELGESYLRDIAPGNDYENTDAIAAMKADKDEFLSMDVTQQAGVYREEIRKVREELDRLNTTRREMANNPKTTQAELDDIDAQIDAAEERLTNLENDYTTFYGDLDKIISPMAEAQVQNLSAEDFLGLSYEEIVDVLVGPNSSYQWIREAYEAKGGEAGEAYLNGIVRSMNPEAWAQAQMTMLQSNINNSDNRYASGQAQALSQLENFGEENRLSNVQLMDIAQFVDWDSPNLDQELANLLQRIRDALKAGVSIDDFISIEQAGGPEEYLRNITSDQVDNEALQKSALTLYNNNDYMDQYANDLEQVPPLIKEITEAQLRYNEAVEFSTSNMEKWNDTLEDLENGNVNLENLSDTMEDLRETYKDFLDLNEDVSDSFIRDKKNLKLLEEAIEGNEEAYEDLAEAAAVDITQQLGIEVDQESVDEAVEAVHSIYDILDNENFEALDVGELINLDNLPGLYDAIDEYVGYLSSLGLGVEDIQQRILDLFGIYIPIDNFVAAGEGMVGTIDEAAGQVENTVQNASNMIGEALSFAQKTTVESDTDEQVDNVEYTELIPEPGPEVEITSTMPAGQGGDISPEPFTAIVRGVQYRASTFSVPQARQSTGQSISSEVEQGKGSTGGVTLADRGSGTSNGWRKGPTGGSKSSGSAAPRSKGGGGGSCFAAGTLISLQNQFKNIEDIQIGDIVLSYNEEIHQNEYSIVLQTMIHDVTEEIYDLYIEDEILTVTGIHRFYVRRKHDIEWVPAFDLHIGDYVLFADGNWHPIFKIKVKIRSLLVYNFEVSHNHNYYVGHNQILAHNKGGGGGGSKAKTIQKKEKKKHEKDYYEEVDSQLDKIKEQLAGIEKQEDKLIGDKARANQAKQIALLNKEIVLQERKLDILQKQEMPETKTKLDESIAELGDILSKYGLNLNMPKLEYDEDGIISNFEDISQLITDKYNELVSKQWAIADSANEEANKEIEDAMSNFEKAGDKTKDLIQKLNDLQKTQIEWTNAIQESKDAVEDLNIELYKTSMEAIDNLKDLNEKWAEFQGFLTGMPSDSPFRELTVDLLKLNSTFEISKKDAEEYYQQIIDGKLAARDATDDKAEKEAIQASINYFTGLKEGLTDDMLKNGLLGLAMADLKELEKWYKDPSLKDNPFKDNQKALVEAYQEGYKRVLELSQDWQDLQEDIVDDVIDGFDEIADKQDRQLEKYERLAEELEQLADTYALSYGDESYKALSDIGKRQAETLKAQLGQYVNIYNYWEQQYEAAIDTGNEELINSIEDRMNDVQDEMRDLAQESAEAFVEAYENAMDAAVQNMYQGLFNENNLDHLDRNWEWDKKVIDNYRDEVEKTFEIEQLRSKYNDLLNDAQGSSLATQNKIRKQMQEQLDLLKNQESMSEYDVELANSKLLILQKQIALENTQQNKNQMQLRRDSQGNYRYVYRASQNDIAKARQEYMQAVQDAYELTKEQRQKTAEELSNTLKDYANEWRDLSTNMNLTEEQRLNQSKELTTKFLEYMKHLNEDLTDSQLGMSDVLNFMVENGTADVAAAAQQMLGQLFDDQGNLIEDTDIAWWDFGNDLAKKLFPYIEDATSTMNSTLEKEADELREKLTGPNGVIKEVTNAIAGENGLRPALEDATKAIVGENGLDAAMDSLADSLENQNKKLTEGMENIKKYTEGLAAALDWLKTAQDAIKDLQDITVGELVSETSAPLPEEAKSEEPKPAVITTTTTAKPATNTNKLNKDRVLAAYNEIMSGRAGNEDARWRYLTNKGYTNAEQDAAQAVVNAVYGGSGRDAALKRIVGYASGGYTGEWNKDGKLAFLHQKELILNAEDTRNILSAVDIVRQMTSTLGNALTNYSIGGARNSLMNSGFGTVDQRVEIKAEFPNVRDAFEIETALTNLSDKAYQYAHRKI